MSDADIMCQQALSEFWDVNPAKDTLYLRRTLTMSIYTTLQRAP